MASNTIKGLTVEIGGDTTKLGKAIKDVEAKSRALSKELGDINKLLKMDPGNTDLLAQKQKVLGEAAAAAAKKLETLKEAERQVQEQFERGEASEEQLRALQREIVATENKMKGYQKAAQQTAEEVEKLGNGAGKAKDGLGGTGDEAQKSGKKVRDFADAAEDAEASSSSLGSTLAGVAKAGFAAVGAAAAAAIGGLVAAAESTREYRTEMGKLETAFTTSGHSTEAAAAAYQTLVGVIGETDQAVEAAQQIALLADSTEDVAKWSELAAGVAGRFGDALMPETFYEAANETLKLNEATGAYVQLLEGTGYSVDEFNAGLAAATTAEEKQVYMLAITQELLGAAGDAYRETNGEIIRANQANDAWMQSLSGVGAAVEPIVTDVKMMAAAMLGEAVPAVQQLADAFRGMMNGDAGAADQFGAALSGLISGLVQKISAALPTVMQQAVNVIGNFVTGLQTYLPQVLAKGAEILGKLGEGIRQNLPSLISQALDIIMRFAETIYTNAPALIQTGFDLLSNLVQGILDSLPTLLSKAPEIISKFANVINDNFTTILAKGVQLVGQIILGIIKAIPTLIANIPKIITAIVDVWEAFNWLNLGKKAITWLKDGVLKMAGSVKSAGKSILTAAVEGVKNLPTQLLNLGKNAISGLGNALRSGASTVKSGATAIFNAVVNTVKNLPSKMLSIGGDLVRGLWNGISNMTGWIIGKIQSFTSSVLDGIKSFFGVHSPARSSGNIKTTDWVGEMLNEGLAGGLIDSADTPINAMRTVTGGVLDAAKDINGLEVERGLQVQHVAAQSAAAPTVGIGDKLDKILAAIEKGQILTIDKKQLIGGTANDYDSTLGQRRALVARGAL